MVLFCMGKRSLDGMSFRDEAHASRWLRVLLYDGPVLSARDLRAGQTAQHTASMEAYNRHVATVLKLQQLDALDALVSPPSP